MSTMPLSSGKPRRLVAVVCAAVLWPACSGDDSTSGADQEGDETRATDTGAEQPYPDVVAVGVEPDADLYDFAVTISSPYDTPDRYADGWRIIGADGTVYGEHQLAHDHANEQPFTRTQQGVAIPEGVGEVTVEGRDSQNGYGGQTVTVTLPDRTGN